MKKLLLLLIAVFSCIKPAITCSYYTNKNCFLTQTVYNSNDVIQVAQEQQKNGYMRDAFL